jgi:hypothetical protein
MQPLVCRPSDDRGRFQLAAVFCVALVDTSQARGEPIPSQHSEQARACEGLCHQRANERAFPFKHGAQTQARDTRKKSPKASAVPLAARGSSLQGSTAQCSADNAAGHGSHPRHTGRGHRPHCHHVPRRIHLQHGHGNKAHTGRIRPTLYLYSPSTDTHAPTPALSVTLTRFADSRLLKTPWWWCAHEAKQLQSDIHLGRQKQA